MENHSEDQDIRNAIHTAIEGDEPEAWRADDASEQMMQAVIAAEASTRPAGRRIPHPRKVPAWRWGGAAAVLLAVGSGWWLTHGPNTAPPPPTVEASQSAAEQAFTWLGQHGSGDVLGGPLWQPTYSPSLSATVRIDQPANTWEVSLWKTPHAFPVNSPAVEQGRMATIISWRIMRVAGPSTVSGLQARTPWVVPTGPSQAVTLGHGVVGAQYTQGQTGQVRESGDILEWHVRHWHFELVASQVTPAVRREAIQLVDFVTTHAMPGAPGVLVANVPAQPTDPVTTQALWATRHVWVNLTNNLTGAQNPLETAHMVSSWRWISR